MARDLNASSVIPSDYTTYNINTGTVTPPAATGRSSWTQAISEAVAQKKQQWASGIDSLFVRKFNTLGDIDAVNTYLRSQMGYTGKDIQGYKDLFSAAKFNFQAPELGSVNAQFVDGKVQVTGMEGITAGLSFFDNFINQVNQFKSSGKYGTIKNLQLADQLAAEKAGRNATILGSQGSAKTILGSPITQNKTLIGG